jgi:hypothetical protein
MIVSTLVDSNVILDVATEDDEWVDWSAAMLAEAGQRGPLVINPLIYAEVAARYATIEALDDALSPDYYTRAALPWPAAFLAGKCFVAYRRRGGVKKSSLPDFYIGAHAAVAGMTLLTRDATRYRTYFPKLHIIAP